MVGNGPQSKISEFETTFINQELFKKIGSPYLSVVYAYYKSHPQMVSNESWHLYTPIESLKTILSSVVFPQDAVEVT